MEHLPRGVLGAYHPGYTQGMRDPSSPGVLNLATTDLFGVGSVLCVLGCLAAPLANSTQMKMSPAVPTCLWKRQITPSWDPLVPTHTWFPFRQVIEASSAYSHPMTPRSSLPSNSSPSVGWEVKRNVTATIKCMLILNKSITSCKSLLATL